MGLKILVVDDDFCRYEKAENSSIEYLMFALTKINEGRLISIERIQEKILNKCDLVKVVINKSDLVEALNKNKYDLIILDGEFQDCLCKVDKDMLPLYCFPMSSLFSRNIMTIEECCKLDIKIYSNQFDFTLDSSFTLNQGW